MPTIDTDKLHAQRSELFKAFEIAQAEAVRARDELRVAKAKLITFDSSAEGQLLKAFEGR